MSVQLSGSWREAEVNAYLATSTVPLRLASTGEDGFPRVISVWYRFVEGRLVCVAHSNSLLVRLLQKSPKVGFEIAPNEPPYCGVRGQGLATVGADEGNAVLNSLLERYLGGTDSGLAKWLLSRGDDERLVVIEPVKLFSWDYSERMQ